MISDWNRTHADYTDDETARVRSALLSVASIIGRDLLQDVVLVGGLVPQLHFREPPAHVEAHVGTRDIDLALQLSVFNGERYATIAQALKNAGLTNDTNVKDDGSETIRQARWKLVEGSTVVFIDFIMAQPDADRRRPGTVKHLGNDFGAFVMDAASVTAHDFMTMTLEGTTLKGEQTKANIRVVGLAGFVVLKAFALVGRRKPKDAYDLCWVLQAAGPEVVGNKVRDLPGSAEKAEALTILEDRFASAKHEGPRWVLEFNGDAGNLERAEDLVGLVRTFLSVARSVP